MTTVKTKSVTVRLGESDIWISPIGLGTWQFSQGHGLVGKFWPRLDGALILSIVKEALNHGIDWFDSAEVYGGGRSEEVLGEALRELKVSFDSVFIATKWWPLLRSATHLEQSVPIRRAALGQWPIMLYQIHQPYSRSTIDQQMESMARLLDRGLIKHAGVSNFSLRQMLKAHRALKSHGHRLVSNQVRYHLLDRRMESNGILAAAEDLGMSIIAYSPLAQGLLTGKFHENNRVPWGMRKLDPHFGLAYINRTRPLINALQAIAEAYQVTPGQVALNWIIARPGGRILAIPGATRVSQAAQNADAMGWRLSTSDRQALDHESSRVVVR